MADGPSRWGMFEEFDDERLGYERVSEYLNSLDDEYVQSSWMRQGLDVALRQGKVSVEPEYWSRDDGIKLVYHNRAHSFVGEAESLKSWAALQVVIDFARKDEGVVYVDCESTVDVFARRLVTLVGMEEAYRLEKYIAYLRPDEPLWERVWDSRERKWSPAFTPAASDFEAVGRAYQASLLVVDGVTELMALHTLDINAATDVATYHRMFLRRWPGAITTLEIDHVAKGDFGESGPQLSRGAIGSQHKRAGIDGAAYLFTPVKKGGVGGESSSRVSLIKDREGSVRRDVSTAGDVGLFILDSSGSGIARCLVQAHSELEEEDIANMILLALSDLSMGNKTLAEYLNKPLGKVRRACEMLETGGLIERGDKQQWKLADD